MRVVWNWHLRTHSLCVAFGSPQLEEGQVHVQGHQPPQGRAGVCVCVLGTCLPFMHLLARRHCKPHLTSAVPAPAWQLSDEYLNVNPIGELPALQIDGHTLTQSVR